MSKTKARHQNKPPYATVGSALQKLALQTLNGVMEHQRMQLDTAAASYLMPYSNLAEATDADKMAASEARQRFLMGTPQNWQPYQMALLPRVSSAIPKGILGRWEKLHPGTPRSAAAFLLGALGRTAWSSLAFRRRAALCLNARLSQEVLMAPDPAPMPLLSDALWWILLSLAETNEELSASFTRIAETAMATKGWAGFWDQYLLHRVAKRGGALPELAVKLPLCLMGAAALSADEVQDPVAVRSGWRTEAPNWASALIEGRI